MSLLQGKVALVTGASRGIGSAIADELARQGAHVVGTATTQAGADAISARFIAAGAAGAGAVLDVTEPQSIDELLNSMKQDGGTPEILVNNAGITRDQLLLRMSDDDWDEVMATNLKAVFRLSKACLRPMLKAKAGRIINIASVIGAIGNAGQSNYAAAKAGIIGFTKSVAREVGSRGITANVIAPGFIDTDMTRELPEAQRDALVEQIPLHRLGLGADIAAAVAFLAGPGGGYITGETLHVNGGMYMA